VVSCLFSGSTEMCKANECRHFSGDEAFDTTPTLDVSKALGGIGEGKKKDDPNPSRL